MAHLTRSIRVAVSKSVHTRVQIPRGYTDARIRWGGIALALSPLLLVVLFAGLYAATADETRRPVMVVLVLGMAGLLFSALGALAPMWNLRKRELRFARRGPLRFVSRRFGGLLQLGSAMCFGAAAGLVARSLTVEGVPEVMGAFGSPASLILLILLGLLVAGIAAFKAIEPPGLKLDEHGLWIRRRFAAHLIAWEEIDRVSVRLDGNIAALVIRLTRGYDVMVQQKIFGSDPLYVAEVVSHFLRTPHHRAALNNPVQALGLAVVLASGE